MCEISVMIILLIVIAQCNDFSSEMGRLYCDSTENRWKEPTEAEEDQVRGYCNETTVTWTVMVKSGIGEKWLNFLMYV